MTALLEAGDSLPLRSFDDLHPILDDCRQKRILDPHQCLSVLNLLRLGRAVKRVLEKHPQASRLQNRGRRLEPLTPLLRDLERCLDEEGEIRDNASPELRQALRDVGTAKEKLESRVKKLFGTAGFKDALQETYATEREGRLVLPIRSEYRSRVEGIIHD
ncbi:MAG: endonuclease MutS2, partial [Nitrospinaceae bacterium]|nr:endonuclease MutS2 [Nitrospinaceae bacterium]NIR56894.1 endonuclease MutS2 [Nitrospinaceae bacterium]NIS87355.1 endonuclease MutS2 [Nitrospinaceae bacterium]NIT84211.1 endonuclease MutS2 [Nitrospinaceae bacterium]NIU46395.1 endonuclease MutS2 [Nitrospinaceae bacterium]